MTRLLLGFMLLTALMADKCDFNLGELNKFVVTYELKVVNSSPVALAAVTVRMKGVARSATLGKGKSLDVLAFGGGDYTISVSDIGLRLKQLKDHRDLLRLLIDTAIDPAHAAELQPQLKATMDAIAKVEASTGTTCSGTVKPGGSATVVLSEQAGSWSC